MLSIIRVAAALLKLKPAVNVEAFPAVSGQVLHNGEPISNFKLRRGYIYIGSNNEEPVWDETHTDAQGHFNFAEIIIQSKNPNMPYSTNRFAQLIDIQDPRYPEYKDVYLWRTTSPGINHIPLLAERLATLNCDLNSNEVSHQMIDEKYEGAIRHEVHSICRWPALEANEIKKRALYGEW
ncbi:DUF6795 domain-containing protein [Shewanella waksmanii]|uniref:DUF6795 domain-containing protein n=1 Tax=Shewanella waksmanii TaxID=213783 RepID=UPI0037366735